MALCKRIKTGNPVAEAPVRSKNFFGIPATFSFKVRNINAVPSKKKTAKGEKNNREPASKALNGGIKNWHTIKMKTPTNAQNITQRNLPFTSSHLQNNSGTWYSVSRGKGVCSFFNPYLSLPVFMPVVWSLAELLDSSARLKTVQIDESPCSIHW